MYLVMKMRFILLEQANTNINRSTVNLLLISDDTKQHYSWIKHISKLLSLQTSKDGHVRHVCFRCLNTFKTEKLLASHHEYCKSHEAIKIELPKEGTKIYFKNPDRSMRVHLLSMLILNPSRHSYQHFNQTITRVTPNGIRNTSTAEFVTT